MLADLYLRNWIQEFGKAALSAGAACLWFSSPAVAQNDSPTAGAVTTYAVLEGRIFDAGTKQPLAGMAVHTFDCWEDSKPVLTDSEGHFRIELDEHYNPRKLPTKARQWSLIISALEKTPYKGKHFQSITVREGDNVYSVGVWPNARIRGKVVNEQGQPVDFAQAMLWAPDLETVSISTDENGVFASDDVPVNPRTGRFSGRISISADRFSYFAAPLTLKAAYGESDIRHIKSTLLRRATVTVHLTRGGKPAQNVVVVPRDPGGADLSPDSSHDRGYERIPSKTPNTFAFTASVPQTRYLELRARESLPLTIPVRLVPGQELTLTRDLAPYPWAAISGRVTDAHGRPIPGCHILLSRREENDSDPVTKSDRHGYYRIAKVALDSNYKVSAVMPRARGILGPERRNVRVRPGRTTIINFVGDAKPPQLRVKSPVSAATVSGVVSFEIEAQDNAGLMGIWLSNGSEDDMDYLDVTTDENALALISERPASALVRRRQCTLTWDSRTVKNGWVHLAVRVYDIYANDTTKYFRLRVDNPPKSANDSHH